MTATTAVRKGRERSSLLVAWSLFGLILTGLALLDAKTPRSTTLVPSLKQLGRAAQLFHGPFPYLAKLPVLSLAVLAWSSVLALWFVYLWLVRRTRESHLDVRWIAAGAVGLSSLALVIAPLFSTDIFSYAMFGRLAGVYDLNPYLTTASSSARSDPLMPYLYWRNIASPYGPLWSLFSWFVTHGAGATPFVLVIRFKLVALSAVMVNGLLIRQIVRMRWPEQADWTYLAFAWNPLVLFDGIVVGHNDILILTLVLLSALLLIQSRPAWTIVGLTASALVKYSTMPIIGVALLREIFRTPARRRISFVAHAGALVLPLAVGTFLPFWSGPSGFMSTMSEPNRGITNPAWRIVCWMAPRLSGGRLSLASPTAVVVIALTLFAAWQLYDLWRQRGSLSTGSVHEDLAAWSRTLIVFLLLWPRLHTWYVLVPTGLALAAGPNHRRLFLQVLGLTLLSYLAYV